MVTDFHSRLKMIIEGYLNLSLKAFEVSYELGDKTIVKCMRNRTSVKSDLLGKLFLEHPELDANWLFKGTGKMIIDEKAHLSIAAEPMDKYVTRDELEKILKKITPPK